MDNALSTVYRTFFKRTPVTVVTVVVAAFFFERLIDQSCDKYFDKRNEGKLWKDVKKRLQLE